MTPTRTIAGIVGVLLSVVNLAAGAAAQGEARGADLTKRGPRNVIPITGGEVTGRINATVLPGGADYQNLSPPATIDVRYLWQTADDEIVIVRNGGAFGSLVPTFEVRADSPYAWLNAPRS